MCANSYGADPTYFQITVQHTFETIETEYGAYKTIASQSHAD